MTDASFAFLTIPMVDIISFRFVCHVLDGLCNEGPPFWDPEIDRVRGMIRARIFSFANSCFLVKHVQEYGWLTVSESFLAMTIFRDEFDAKFVLIFSTVLFIKGFHWIARDRVDYVPKECGSLSGFTF